MPVAKKLQRKHEWVRQYPPKGSDLSVTAKQSWMSSLTKSTTDLARVWGYNPCCGANRTAKQQPTQFKAHPLTNAALHFTFESTNSIGMY
jgi:hypothetical protein